MITIAAYQNQTIKLSLNRAKVSLLENVVLNLVSPSRVELNFTKALTELGSGFFSIDVTSIDTAQLVDDTYSYYLYQDSVLLKTGFVRRIEVSEEFSGELDAELDFYLA